MEDMTGLNDLTIVADIGARYGIHPSWNGYDAPLRYIAFEPDSDEACRLRGLYKDSAIFRYEVLETALDKQKGQRDFHLLKHRGLSSCLKPDLNSECFRYLKPGQAEIEKIIKIETERADDVFANLGLVPDFLKVDTEGTEQDVVEGCERLLSQGVLGVRLSCNFQPCFIGQRLFSDSHDYLTARGFVLLNLDYKGFGYPRLGLFRKPDPTESEDHRYGILVAADAVWIRKPENIARLLSDDQATFARLKLAAFCLFNNAPDVGVDILRESAESRQLSEAVKAARLYKMLRLKCARFLGRYRTVPDEQWERASGIFRSIFGNALLGGSDFFPQVTAWSREMAEG
jgi:FkbM family methyltransferase